MEPILEEGQFKKRISNNNYQNQDNFNRFQEPISQREQISSNRPFTNQNSRASPGYNNGSSPVVISFDDDIQTNGFAPA